MLIHISHKTSYSYDAELKQTVQVIRLTPPQLNQQKVVEWNLKFPSFASTYIDGYGNLTHLLTLDENIKDFVVEANGIIETIEQPSGIEADGLSELLFLKSTPLTEISESMILFITDFKDLVQQRPGMILADLSRAILEKVHYIKGSTNVNTTAAESFELGAGVCQDHTHIFLSCCRYLGFPARYVSGYLLTDSADHLATHAWAEVWFGNRWQAFDISNQCFPSQNHVKLAIGLDYLEAGPIRGSRLGGGLETLRTDVHVTNTKFIEREMIQ